MKVVLIILGVYLFISLCIGISDLILLKGKENNLIDVPIGDLEFYKQDPITGIHNIVFFPSLIVIIIYWGFVTVINKIIYKF